MMRPSVLGVFASVLALAGSGQATAGSAPAEERGMIHKADSHGIPSKCSRAVPMRADLAGTCFQQTR
jgi:hypothetical protein